MKIFNRIRKKIKNKIGGNSDIVDLNRELERKMVGGGVEPIGDGMAYLVSEAWKHGQEIDIGKAVYGPAHWGGAKKFADDSFPYYHFLAGLVRTQDCQHIIEIGTHFGGSTLAMHAGFNAKRGCQIITLDITDENRELHEIPEISKFTGDANSELQMKKVLLEAPAVSIDLLYVDAAHDFWPTLQNIAIYAAVFRPRFIVIDDIVLNDEMRLLWAMLKRCYGDRAVNCVDLIPAIRSAQVGFGLIDLRS